MKWWFEIKTDSKHVYILPQNDQGQKFVFVKGIVIDDYNIHESLHHFSTPCRLSWCMNSVANHINILQA